MPKSKLKLFEGNGIELEYMIVDRDGLDVRPIADKILFKASGAEENEVAFPDISWSNELALHVIELKTSGPRKNQFGLHLEFQDHVKKVNLLLAEHNATLLPTSMHPWMDPKNETKLWPHGNKIIYKTYNKLFDCNNHGWSNLQSVHLNLSFQGDEEFTCLHESIRALLPIMSAIVASSPIVEGKKGPCWDTRLWYYKGNQKKISSIIGDIIPESVNSQKEYERIIWDKIMEDIRSFDPEGVLEAEWLNSRAAIARFDRMAIEIRVLDIQECPLADISVTYFISEVLKRLIKKFQDGSCKTGQLSTLDLKKVFLQVLEGGDETLITDKNYLSFFDFQDRSSVPVKDLWWSLFQKIDRSKDNEIYLDTISYILQKGPLSSRILRRVGSSFDKNNLKSVYQELRHCLSHGELFKV